MSASSDDVPTADRTAEAAATVRGAQRVYPGPWGYANWLAFLDGAPEVLASECELYSDASFTHEMLDVTSPYQIFNRIVLDGGMRPALTLRIAMHLPGEAVMDQLASMQRAERPLGDISRFHGGDIRDELAALLSLAIGVRLQAGGFTREFRPEEDARGRPVSDVIREPRAFSQGRNRPIVPDVAGAGQRALQTDLLHLYPTLKPEDAVVLLRAARSYQEAMWIAEADPQFAWLLLVSAVEAAANQWFPIEGRGEVLSEAELLEAFKADLVKYLRSIGGQEAVDQVAREFVGQMKTTDKFIKFIDRFKPSPPTPRPPKWSELPWASKTKFREALNLVYTARSYALHEGVPFPPPTCKPPMAFDVEGVGRSLTEIPPGSSAYQDGGFWVAPDLPMLLNTFAYIARSSLVSWWRWIASKSKSSAKPSPAL